MHYNKLDALRTLSSAYHYVREREEVGDAEAAITLATNFGRVRRSLTMWDLLPQAKSAEGWNGKGPTFL